MKQIGLLPSGCQTWHKDVLGSGGEHFVYAATLATYQHEQSGSQRLIRLQTAHERTITGLAWQQNHPTNYCTAGADMRIIKWTVGEEKEGNSTTVPNIPIMIDWAGHAGLEEPLAILIKPGNVATWDPTTGKQSAISDLKDVTSIRWNHSTKSPLLAAGRVDGSVWVYDKRGGKVVQKIDAPREKVGEIVDLAWDPLSNQYLLAAYRSGIVVLLDTESGQVLQEFHRPVQEPTMIAFVPSSPGDFLTINAQAATLTLWNVSQPKPKEVIKVDAGSKKCGLLAIKLLNTAAPPPPTPIIQAPAPPTTSAASKEAAAQAAAAAAAAAAAPPVAVPPPPFSKFLLAYLDGSVGLYDWSTRHIDFLTTPAHSETIFDVRFKPSSPDILATASYDSTVKIWNMNGLTLSQELKGQSGVLYGLSWCPGGADENRIASAGSEGDVVVWDSKTGQQLHTSKHHSKPVFGLKWHPTDKDLIVSTSSDNYAVLFTPQGKIQRKIKHPAAVYGCDWSPFHKNQLVTGCHDGIVRVWDTSKEGSKPAHELQGHNARVFNTVWSPLIPDRLASGSDDRTIRIWDVSPSSTGKVIVLQGHTHNVRAITWSTEVPYLLFSGAWDGTIRVWDIRDGKCLHVIDDHHADVYGLASHPSRPFSFVSSSRDTSLRFWTTDETLAAKIKIQAILSEGLIQPSHLDEVQVVMKPGAPFKLCGAASKEMVGKPVRDLKDLERYAKLFDFCTNMQGVKELWKLLEALVNNKPSDSTTSPSLVHVNDVRPLALANARAIYKSKNLSYVGVGRREDRLAAAAKAYLSIGLVREYCEIQIELGLWTEALSIAPAASMSYWKLLLVRHAYFLREKGDHTESALAFLASGEVKLLLAQQTRSKDLQGAFLSAVCDATGNLPILPPFEPEEEKKFNALVAAQNAALTGSASSSSSSSSSPAIGIPLDDSKIERDNVPVSDSLREVAELQSQQQFAAGNSVLAACALLRIGDAMGCVQKLVLGNELLLALAVCRVLQLQFCDDVFLATASLCEELGLWDDALKCLLSMRDPQDELTLLAARYQGPANLKAEFYLKVGIRSQEAWAQAAEQCVKDGKHVDALTAFVASGQYEKATTVGLDYLREALSASSWSVEDVSALMKPLNSIPAVLLREDLRNQLLIYSYFLGAQTAMNKGYTQIVTFLFDSVIALVGKLNPSGSEKPEKSGSASPVSFPLPIGLVKLQEASYLQAIDPARALQLLKEVLESKEGSTNTKLKASATQLKKLIETVHATPAALAKVHPPSRNLIIPSCSHLPTGGSATKLVTSVISGKVITGPRLNVDQPLHPQPIPGLPEGAQNLNAAHVGLNEALMLVKCTPFSPNHTGQRLKIFA